MKFLSQICFTSQNYLCPAYKFTSKLQLKFQNIIVHIAMNDPY